MTKIADDIKQGLNEAIELESKPFTHFCFRDDPKCRYTLERIYGDCLEGAGLYLPHQGYAIIDHNPEFLKVGDLVWCAKYAGTIGGYIKQVKVSDPNHFVVGTNYLDDSKNIEWEPEEVFGKVVEVYDRMFGNQIYAVER